MFFTAKGARWANIVNIFASFAHYSDVNVNCSDINAHCLDINAIV
jgi:hypothetical protein